MQSLQTFRELTLGLLQSSSDKQLQQVQKQILHQHHHTRQRQHPHPRQHHKDRKEPPPPAMVMAKRYFVETAPGGRPQVVLKRSRSYGGQQSRVREIDYVKVSLDEWNSLVEKERALQQVNRAVVDETNALKSTLLGAQAENKRLNSVVIAGLDRQLASLAVENESLRRARGPNDPSAAVAAPSGSGPLPSAIKKTYREEEKLRARIGKLEERSVEIRNENLKLQERNRSLQRQVDEALEHHQEGRRSGSGGGVPELATDVEYWKSLARSWRSRYVGLRRRYDELYDLLETRSKKLRAYEDILERNGMV